MNYCATCGKYTYEGNTNLMGKPHKCLPEYEVIDFDEDWDQCVSVYSMDHEDAAQDYCEKMDDGSGEGPRERTVLVRKKHEERIVKFKVSFEYSVDYYAHTEEEYDGE